MLTSDEPALTLYHSATSVCSAKVRLVLCELGLGWKSVTLDLTRGEQFDPDYLRLNPQAVVPTLIESGRAVIESNTIMRHLVDRYGKRSPELYSPRCDAWLQRSLPLHDAINTFTQLIVNRPRLLTLPAADLEARYARIPDPARAEKLRNLVVRGFEADEVATATRCLQDTIAEIENAAKNAPWLAGDTFTLADMAILPFVNRHEMLGMSALWEVGSSTARWFEAAKGRPCYEDAIASFVSEATSKIFAAAVRASRAQIDNILVAD